MCGISTEEISHFDELRDQLEGADALVTMLSIEGAEAALKNLDGVVVKHYMGALGTLIAGIQTDVERLLALRESADKSEAG